MSIPGQKRPTLYFCLTSHTSRLPPSVFSAICVWSTQIYIYWRTVTTHFDKRTISPPSPPQSITGVKLNNFFILTIFSFLKFLGSHLTLLYWFQHTSRISHIYVWQVFLWCLIIQSKTNYQGFQQVQLRRPQSHWQNWSAGQKQQRTLRGQPKLQLQKLKRLKQLPRMSPTSLTLLIWTVSSPAEELDARMIQPLQPLIQ